MNKLNEILRPKIAKEEAKTLAKLIGKRFAEILDKNFLQYCISEEDECENCIYYDNCDFVDKCLSEMDKVVDKLSEALGIFIWFDWDADEIEIKIDRILPDEDDEDWIFSYVLRCKVYANPSSLENINEDDFLFEPETIVGLREEWRCSNELFRKIWLKRDIPAFFEGDSYEKA